MSRREGRHPGGLWSTPRAGGGASSQTRSNYNNHLTQTLLLPAQSAEDPTHPAMYESLDSVTSNPISLVKQKVGHHNFPYVCLANVTFLSHSLMGGLPNELLNTDNHPDAVLCFLSAFPDLCKFSWHVLMHGPFLTRPKIDTNPMHLSVINLHHGSLEPIT